jgi:hypothetical protein
VCISYGALDNTHLLRECVCGLFLYICMYVCLRSVCIVWSVGQYTFVT